jgi:glycosyltransferase involved in cell wall biosynthesis
MDERLIIGGRMQTVSQACHVVLPVEHYGLWGGGMPKAAFLLARELRALGCVVTVVTLHTRPSDVAASEAFGIRVRRSRLSFGHRWRLPQVGVAFGGLLECLSHPRSLIIAIGTDAVAASLLALPFASRVAVWECTEATAYSPFVSPRASRRLHRARAVLVPSAAVEQNVRRNYGYQGPVLRLPFWVEAPDCTAAAHRNQAGEGVDFVYLGRKDKKKGLYELLGAVARLRASGVSARLLICGPGDDAPFSAYAEETGISGLVRFAYFADQREVLEALRGARWLVLPSHSEGYPLTLLEAFAQGRPVIATQVGSVPEMCGDSPAAALVPARDEAALAQAMERALAISVEEYAMRQQAARTLFERLSGPQAVRERLAAVWEGLTA